MPNHFRVTGHFETVAPHSPKMTLNTKMSNVLHMHGTTIPESQISVRLSLYPAVFELHAILRQVNQMSHK